MPSINQLADSWLRHCADYYRKPKTRRPTGEAASCETAVRPLRLVAGTINAETMTAAKLAEARRWLLGNTANSRKTINKKIGQTIRMFRWACDPEQAMLPEEVLGRLLALRPLAIGRTSAPETTGLCAIKRGQLTDVLAALAEPPKRINPRRVPRSVRLSRLQMMTMLELQAESGMRPGELCSMAMEYISPHPVNPDVWVYRPYEHKAEHHGKKREVALYQADQNLIRRWMQVSGIETGRLFSLTVTSYRQGVQRTLKRAGLPKWTPQQVRHFAGTELRRELGIDAAQAQLGHNNVRTTEIYAEVQNEAIIEKIRKHRDG